jgi:hypothetical protein
MTQKAKSETAGGAKVCNILELLSSASAKPGLRSADRLWLARLLRENKQRALQGKKLTISAGDFERLLKAVFGKGGGDDGEDRSAQVIALFFELAKTNPENGDRFAKALGKILIKGNDHQRRELMAMLQRGLKVERPDLADLMFRKLQGDSVTAEALADSLNYPDQARDSALRQAYRLLEEAGMPPQGKRGRPRKGRAKKKE